jgi:hypothetical protein
MKKIPLCITCLFLFAATAFTQAKPKPQVKPVVSELNKLLTGSALPFEMINDSLAVIPFEGDNIVSYKVVVQRVSDLFIVFTNLTEALPGKIDETKYKYLLQQNDNYDMVKTGISADDGTCYLRADVYKAGINTVLLKRLIQQVANVANIIGGDLNK